MTEPASCGNCGAVLQGHYCHTCGQRDYDFHRSFRGVVVDAFESFFNFDTKLFRSLGALLFRPGQLTRDFVAGRRTSQMPPLRLYLFVSVIFFSLGVTFNNKTPPVVIEGSSRGAIQQAATAPDGSSPTQAAPSSDEDNDPEWVAAMARKLSTPAAQQRMLEMLFRSLPKVMLFCIPFLALITRILFPRSGLVYLQHLVLALHFQTFLFLWDMVRDGWTDAAELINDETAIVLWGVITLWKFVYPFLMTRCLFAESWTRTVLMTIALGTAYISVIGVGLVLTTAWVIFMV